MNDGNDWKNEWARGRMKFSLTKLDNSDAECSWKRTYAYGSASTIGSEMQKNYCRRVGNTPREELFSSFDQQSHRKCLRANWSRLSETRIAHSRQSSLALHTLRLTKTLQKLELYSNICFQLINGCDAVMRTIFSYVWSSSDLERPWVLFTVCDDVDIHRYQTRYFSAISIRLYFP